MPIVIHQDIEDGTLYREERVHSWDAGRRCVLDDEALWAGYLLAQEQLAKAEAAVLAALRVARPDEVRRG